ncbi:hypothetical protein IV203_027536 [Nitzschia inconspicua]|uniref:DUF6816 domain-containing protein n=1 Tax=Nitzschia inconspicua TaxID=303405 RepID=A0A9K3K3X1_9STRA|nr:hypothetical protein IV203_024853 [Nitzschia inconspicua]KAG7369790.1 hypothetical protein IV203_027536 [Nitzschia inconspicua]
MTLDASPPRLKDRLCRSDPWPSCQLGKGSSSRRSFCSKVAGGVTAHTATSWGSLVGNPAAANAASPIKDIAGRLTSDTLTLPPPSSASELNGIDNTYYPSFLQGEWDVTQTLVDVQAPLGLKYLGGPNANLEIATKSFDDSKSKIGKPVKLRLRYVPTKWGVAEDRIFNNQERLDAFAGRSVVASVSYADVGGCNRQSVLALGGTSDDPLQTTITYFKGPAAQKSFLTSHGVENLSETSWAGYEVLRSIFALTNTNTAPPITTDVEYIWKFEKVDDLAVRGKLRIAEYLNAQSDLLYFDARQRAVSFQDYTLDMRRIN